MTRPLIQLNLIHCLMKSQHLFRLHCLVYFYKLCNHYFCLFQMEVLCLDSCGEMVLLILAWSSVLFIISV